MTLRKDVAVKVTLMFSDDREAVVDLAQVPRVGEHVVWRETLHTVADVEWEISPDGPQAANVLLDEVVTIDADAGEEVDW